LGIGGGGGGAAAARGGGGGARRWGRGGCSSRRRRRRRSQVRCGAGRRSSQVPRSPARSRVRGGAAPGAAAGASPAAARLGGSWRCATRRRLRDPAEAAAARAMGEEQACSGMGGEGACSGEDAIRPQAAAAVPVEPAGDARQDAIGSDSHMDEAASNLSFTTRTEQEPKMRISFRVPGYTAYLDDGSSVFFEQEDHVVELNEIDGNF
ncbi:hypothetical protein EJB05_20686, partial [Eragrostis curvula]